MKKGISRNLVSLLLAVCLLVGLAPAEAFASTPLLSLQERFEMNEDRLRESTAELDRLMTQMSAMHARGALPSIDLIFDRQINSYDLLRGLINGLHIPFLVNIGGIRNLDHFLFHDFTYTTLIHGSLSFPDGILNGSNSVNNTQLPQQSLAARVAAQEYVLYVSEAIVGMLRLIAIADTGLSQIDGTELPDLLRGAARFLEFDIAVMDQARNTMYSLLGSETVRLGRLFRITRSVEDIIRSVDGGGYHLLVDMRNTLLGGQDNVAILVNTLSYVEHILSGELVEKYHTIDFTDVHGGADQLFAYLIADITEARAVLEQLDHLSDAPLTALLDAQGGMAGFILPFLGDHMSGRLHAMMEDMLLSRLPASADFEPLHSLRAHLLVSMDFSEFYTADEALAYLDTVIAALEGIREGLDEIDLPHFARFVQDAASGELLARYHALGESRWPQIRTLFRYVRADRDGIASVLQVADLLDQELYFLLGDYKLRDIIDDYIRFITPGIMREALYASVYRLGALGVGGGLIYQSLSPMGLPPILLGAAVAVGVVFVLISLVQR